MWAIKALPTVSLRASPSPFASRPAAYGTFFEICTPCTSPPSLSRRTTPPSRFRSTMTSIATRRQQGRRRSPSSNYSLASRVSLSVTFFRVGSFLPFWNFRRVQETGQKLLYLSSDLRPQHQPPPSFVFGHPQAHVSHFQGLMPHDCVSNCLVPLPCRSGLPRSNPTVFSHCLLAWSTSPTTRFKPQYSS